MNTRYPAGTAAKQFLSLLEKDFFFFTVLTKKSISRKYTADMQYQMTLFQQLSRVFSSKVASVQSITDIVLLDYGLMVLP